jgi:membrane-bound lytic murein transglycosylase D
VKVVWIIVVALAWPAPAKTQDQDIDVDGMMGAVEVWTRDNLDASVVAAVEGRIDREQLKSILDDLQRRLQADSIYDLASLRQTATALLPLLDRFAETDPYARWLRTRLDYLSAADQLRREATSVPAPKTSPTQPVPTVPSVLPVAPTPPTPPAPQPTAQREMWTRTMADRTRPERADAFVALLAPIFVEEGMPPELVWLAEVESSFDPKAKSPVGAAGLFQLMPPTAKDLGLSTWLPDERLHPEKNARAAAQYLRRLYGRFNDWELALAAYNAGESRVAGLLKKSGTKTFDAIAGRLPAETQMYVPKFEAVLKKRTGMEIRNLKAPVTE